MASIYVPNFNGVDRVSVFDSNTGLLASAASAARITLNRSIVGLLVNAGTLYVASIEPGTGKFIIGSYTASTGAVVSEYLIRNIPGEKFISMTLSIGKLYVVVENGGATTISTYTLTTGDMVNASLVSSSTNPGGDGGILGKVTGNIAVG